MRARRIILLVILALYVILGMLYAVRTPAWQAPDEPAHYNYVRFIAATGGFPVLQMGDYPHGYMEEIKGRKFPPDLSIDPIRYEFHQPPLYYVLLTPIYAVVRGALLPLRLASVLLGLGVVLLAYAVAYGASILSARPWRWARPPSSRSCRNTWPRFRRWATTCWPSCFSRLCCYILVGWVMSTSEMRTADERRRTQEDLEAVSAFVPRSSASCCGCFWGLILITKTTAYIAVPLAGGVLSGAGGASGPAPARHDRCPADRSAGAAARPAVVCPRCSGLRLARFPRPDPPRPDRGRPNAHRRVPGPGRLECLHPPRRRVHLQEFLGRLRLARRLHGQSGLFPGGAVEWGGGRRAAIADCESRIAD